MGRPPSTFATCRTAVVVKVGSHGQGGEGVEARASDERAGVVETPVVDKTEEEARQGDDASELDADGKASENCAPERLLDNSGLPRGVTRDSHHWFLPLFRPFFPPPPFEPPPLDGRPPAVQMLAPCPGSRHNSHW